MGTCVASTIVPTAPMRLAPSWARGEGAVRVAFAHVGHGGHKGAKWSGCRDSSHGAARANRGPQAR